LYVMLAKATSPTSGKGKPKTFFLQLRFDDNFLTLRSLGEDQKQHNNSNFFLSFT
jgi:hypothetical protein